MDKDDDPSEAAGWQQIIDLRAKQLGTLPYGVVRSLLSELKTDDIRAYLRNHIQIAANASSGAADRHQSLVALQTLFARIDREEQHHTATKLGTSSSANSTLPSASVTARPATAQEQTTKQDPPPSVAIDKSKEEQPPKRGPDRPCKNPLPEEKASVPATTAGTEIPQEQPQKRKRGRPSRLIDEAAKATPKRKRGRPRKHSLLSNDTAMKTVKERPTMHKPDRPRKQLLPVNVTAATATTTATTGEQTPKRKRGRPRKHPLPVDGTAPTIVTTKDQPQKRQRGHPRKNPQSKEQQHPGYNAATGSPQEQLHRARNVNG